MDAVPDRQIAEILHVSNRGFAGGLPTLVKTALACTIAFALAGLWHHGEFPVFAPTTALLAIQSSVFGTVGMAVQRVLGTVVGVAGATLFVNTVGLHFWSLAGAMFASLLIARLLPVGFSAQLQVPLSVLLVMVLGPVDPGYGLLRALDTALGGVVGVATVLVWPPAVRVQPVEEAFDRWVVALRDQLERVAQSLEAPPTRIPVGQRHDYLITSRELHDPTAEAREELAIAIEAARLNPLGRRVRRPLGALERRQVQLERYTLQIRGLSYVIDKLYDRENITPRLRRETLAELLEQLAAVLYRSERGGSVDLLSGRLRNAIDTAVHDLAGIPGVRLPGLLDSVGVLGRIEQLRQAITGQAVVLRFADEREGDLGELGPDPDDDEPDDAVPMEPEDDRASDVREVRGQ